MKGIQVNRGNILLTVTPLLRMAMTTGSIWIGVADKPFANIISVLGSMEVSLAKEEEEEEEM